MDVVWIKTKAAGSLLIGVVVAFLLPLIPFLSMVFVLVAVDLFTGVRAAKARKEKITSGGLKRTIEKTCLYFAAIMLSEGMVQVFFPAVPLTYIVAAYIALTEFKSNLENISDVTGVDLWKKIASKISFGKLLQDKAKSEDKEEGEKAPIEEADQAPEKER